ncbi:P-loop containing nucleoside triphosphate hydrolase protein [Roridomyces roridus]|uniref:P-loop containing nucleoside triphosphate hydrolase protein n=1 Tax=Roridomyces roridus TaxID=1738132 RepID=A0AAD7BYL5_9AGAR|nr:P-loop containing nucleoside triphosphate hydrolase protein [Roridomyces roridus]
MILTDRRRATSHTLPTICGSSMRSRALLLVLWRLIRRVGLYSKRSWSRLLWTILSSLRKIATHPQAAELFRFIFLGTIVETGRQVAAKVLQFAKDFFVVRAEFASGDFAYDWVVNYLENHRVWNESRSFKVVARNATTRPYPTSNLGKVDGHPDPLYEPATTQSPSLFRWKGYWMTITKTTAGMSHYDTRPEIGAGYGVLVLSVLTWDRSVLDDFVSEARSFYVNSQVLPRKQFNIKSEPSESLLTAHFRQGDISYDWMLEYLRSSDALKDIMELNVTTKQSDLGWGTGPKDAVRFMPAPESMQRLLFKSPRTGKSAWLQVVMTAGSPHWETSRLVGGSITITFHSSDREVMLDLIDAAKQKYTELGTSRVTVHLMDKYGSSWNSFTRSRRALSTLVLPTDVKEMLLADALEFLDSEKWYNMAGIPHRRGYLLYGAPGTGKSSTVHALAGELGLEIYFISLANPGVDDFSLARLISDTPSRWILLIEDIDCAFPSREDDDEDEDEKDEQRKRDRRGNRYQSNQLLPPKSAVTLSGLLNVLDSVSSEEGRLTFATTNHIKNLDPALIRAGRMDLKIKYSLATASQIEEVFKVFFSETDSTEVEQCASKFAAAVPPEMYSVAQIQGYLLNKKRDPLGAVEGVEEWLKEQEAERRALIESKRRWREEMARRRMEEEQQYQLEMQQQQRMEMPPLSNAGYEGGYVAEREDGREGESEDEDDGAGYETPNEE